MKKDQVLFSSESVTEGHPDKVCDKIADSVLDAALAADPNSRIACEVCCTTGLVLVMGEFTTESFIDIPKIVRETVLDIGYDDANYGFDGKTCAVITTIDEQSSDIAMGVNKALEAREGDTDAADETGAGDQGMMFGYACRETAELMPLPIMLAHALTRKLAEVRKSGEVSYLRPDGKAQVTVAYEDGVPVRVAAVVLSAQHDPGVSHEVIERDMIEKVVRRAIDPKWLTPETEYYINPTGQFVVGGPHGDSGLTGRKIIVDTYGGMCPHGGGAFSGKDPTKVDRSASYYARYVCKNVVASGACDKCRLQVAYAIGKAQPVSLCVETFGTSRCGDAKIAEVIKKVFDFRPASIIRELDLRRPIYARTSNYGHFGDPSFPWERVDKADEIAKLLES